MKIFLLFLMFCLFGCHQQVESKPFPKVVDVLKIKPDAADPGKEDPIKWQERNINVLEKAKTEKKFVFMVVLTDSCGYCKILKQRLESPEFAKLISDNFIPVLIDDSENTILPQLFEGRTSYPTMFFVSHDRSLVQIAQGLGTTEQIRLFLVEAMVKQKLYNQLLEQTEEIESAKNF